MSKVKFKDGVESGIVCPVCSPQRKLVVRTNKNTGHQFLGCPNYPDCKYTREIPEEWIMRALGQNTLFDTHESEQ